MDKDVKYCYPGPQVLVNKFDIRDGQRLSNAERAMAEPSGFIASSCVRIQETFILIFLCQMRGKCWKPV